MVTRVQWHNDLAETLPLDGTWQFALGDQQGTIEVPGAWEAQGYPRRLDGPAVYERTIHIPAGWEGRQVQLQCDAVSYHVAIQVNDIRVGTHTGTWTRFACDLSDVLCPGTDNTIRFTVYKPGGRFGLRESLAGFLPDVAVMFGGVWQSVRLVAFEGPAFSDIAVHADAPSGTVSARAVVHGADGLAAALSVYDPGGRPVADWHGTVRDGAIAAMLAVDAPALWSPEAPQRYTLELRVGTGDTLQAVARRTFGFRLLSHEGERLLFNDRPVMLRGLLNWGWYPDILCPAPDDATIRDEMRRVRALGYNLIKLCLYVPAPRYFEIADEEGMLLWLELPLWLPEMTSHLREQGPPQYRDIMAQVHHHPALVLVSLGCELEQHVDPDWVAALDRIVRGSIHGALVCDNSGSGEAFGYGGDRADFYDYHFYSDLQFFEPLVDHFRRDWREARPWIFGEFCDSDDYRDLDTLLEGYGGTLPWWAQEQNPIHPLSKLAYSQQAARMARLDLPLDGRALQDLSRRESFIVRKTTLERVRARAGMGGYVVTSLRDTPLATSSMFDDFGNSKVDPDAFRAFNADTVLLLGRGRARQWTRGGDRPAPVAPYDVLAGTRAAFDVILAHAGPPLPGGLLIWWVTGPGGFAQSGEEAIPGPLAFAGPRRIAGITFDVPDSAHAAMLRLDVRFETGGAVVQNTWTLWAYPAVTQWPEGTGIYDPCGSLSDLDDLGQSVPTLDHVSGAVQTVITSTFDVALYDFVYDGGAVLLLQNGNRPLPARPLPFWREAIKLIGDHPALDAFPHAGVVDLQFYGLATDWAFDTRKLRDTLPEASAITPLLRRLDARQFELADYLLEIAIGSGRLIASTLRFQGGLGDQPRGLSANLAGRWLLYRLLLALHDTDA